MGPPNGRGEESVLNLSDACAFSSKFTLLLTSRQELHDEVEVDWVLEGVVHLDDPLVVGLNEDVALGAHVRDLLLVDHVALAKDLHRVHVPGVRLLHEANLERRGVN